MPPKPKSTRWKWIAGYTAFALASFAFGLFVTFPYGLVRERIAAEAGNNGLYVKMAGLGPGFIGITATRVEVSRKMEGADDKPPVPLKLDSISLRPSLFPLGIAVKARLLHGSASLAVGLLGDLKLRASLEDLNLQDDNLKAFSGLSLAGHVNGQLSLDLPKTSLSKSLPPEPDLSQATGSLSLDSTDLQVNGGTVAMYDLPKIVLGDLEGRIKFEKGAGTIDRLHTKSDELDLSVAGTLKLAKRIDFSEPNVMVRFRAQPDLTKRLGMIAMGISSLKTDPEAPDYRTLRVQGFLGRPTTPDLRF
jgi:type II secretion system protein N